MKKSLLIIGILFFTKIFAQEATFEALGFIVDSPDAFSEANGVSEDGSVVTGVSYSLYGTTPVAQAYRWENGEISGIGMLPISPEATPWSYARAISADGSTIVGYSASDNAFMAGWEAMRWTQDGGMEGLGDFLPSDYWSESTAVSGDGSVVVGRSYMTGQGFRWENGIMESLSTDDIQFVEAWGISADGAIIAGSAIVNSVQQAALWREDGITGLGAPEGGSSCAFKVSDDGNFAVGFLQGSSGERAFRWAEAEGMMELGTLGGANSQAQDVSNDGTVVVGWSQIASSEYIAFYWTQESGMQNMKDVLENNYGLDLSGWTLITANAVSGDGKTIVGYGLNPDGKQEAWRVVLTSPSGGECMAPDSISIGSTTGTTAEFSWSPVAGETGGYNWFVMNLGESPDTGTPVASGTTDPGVTSATATGLTPSTIYFVYLQTNCSEEEQSNYGGPFMMITTEDMGIMENDTSGFSLYPNPTTGIINLQTKEKISSVSVYNSAGQKVSFNSLNKENTSIDLLNLPSGVYFVEVTLDNKTVKRYKVVRK